MFLVKAGSALIDHIALLFFVWPVLFGAKGVMKPGENSVQVIIGLKVQAVADDLRERM